MEKDDLISIYTGTESSALLLKGKLEGAGISSIIRKASNAGTWGVVPDNIDLLVERSEKKEAEHLLDEFIRKAEKL
jgi:hypothetical protein